MTAGFRISVWRHSCVMFFQECARLVSPAIATIGMPPFSDSIEPGDEVGRAGAERAVADAGPVGDARIGVGGESAAALVVDQMVIQADAGRPRRRTAAAGTRPCRTSARRPPGAASRRAPARRSSCPMGGFAMRCSCHLLSGEACPHPIPPPQAGEGAIQAATIFQSLPPLAEGRSSRRIPISSPQAALPKKAGAIRGPPASPDVMRDRSRARAAQSVVG